MTQPSEAGAASEPAEAGETDGLAPLDRVLALEAQGLEELRQSLDASYRRAVDKLLATPGRIIVTGMGKSGHIARKIAATLASTGSPASFVHPGEASHGDLGMITHDDAVVALSNSGETNELADVIGYTRRFGITLVGFTRRAGSTLASQADVALVLPSSPEACPMRLAPTTSTTAMMALGDALAMALLERRGFSPDDFQTFHPGGALGRRLLRVADIMHVGEELPLVAPGHGMAEALLEMTAKTFGCVGVVDEAGQLAGIITDGDLRRHMASDLLNQRAGDVMTTGPKSIRAGALASEALGVMNAHAITALFVTDDGRPVGILNVHDCLRAGVV